MKCNLSSTCIIAQTCLVQQPTLQPATYSRPLAAATAPPEPQRATPHGRKRGRSSEEPSSEVPAKKQSKWTDDENRKIIHLRGNNEKWETISQQLPGRSAISCRLHYQNFLERRPEWDEEKKNKMARLYDRYVPRSKHHIVLLLDRRRSCCPTPPHYVAHVRSSDCSSLDSRKECGVIWPMSSKCPGVRWKPCIGKWVRKVLRGETGPRHSQ